MSKLQNLNDGERRVLTLLAEGHTVKSIANATGMTVAAVNERLRSARRKTGAGSSRELARLFAQQPDPKKIGLEVTSNKALNVASSGEIRRSKWKGVAVMLLVLIAAIGGILAFEQPQSPNQSDPMIENALDPRPPIKVLDQMRAQHSPDKAFASEGSQAILRGLHSQVRTEERDPNWSPKMETELRSYFLNVPSVQSSPAHLRVLCSATLCEVTTNLPNRHFAVGQLYLPEFQDPKQDAAIMRLGLKPLAKVLGSTKAGPLYLGYFGRNGRS